MIGSALPLVWPDHRLIALSLLAIGMAACKQEQQFVAPPPPKVTVSNPVKDNVTVYSEGPGRLGAINSVKIMARVDGFIDEIFFQDGRYVEEGDLLFRIEPARYEAVVREAQAALDTAEATLALSDATLTRLEKAASKGAVSEIDVIEARSAKEAANASVNSAKATLERAELELSYTEVKAPFHGRISERFVSVGDYVGANGQTVLAEVVSLDPIYVYWNASERDLLEFQKQGKRVRRADDGGTLPEDQRVYVKLRLADGTVYDHQGYIDYAAPTIDKSTGTLLIRVTIDNPDARLFPGQFARVLVESYSGEAILVPETAVQRDVVGPYLLAVESGNKVVRKDVKLGELLDTTRRIVLEGITPADRIITVGIQRARPGATVDPEMAPAFPDRPNDHRNEADADTAS